MHVMMISTHSPESCPMSNKESKKAMETVIQQVPTLAAKHGIKIVGVWADIGTHTTYGVYDSPSMDAFLALLNQPELAAWVSFNTVRFAPVLTKEETDAMFER